MGKEAPVKNLCAKCCIDFDIDPLDLLFPARLSPVGREFVDAHGVLDKPLSQIMQHAVELPNGFIKILHTCQHLTVNGLCSIYDERPQICRDYKCESNPNCTNKPVKEGDLILVAGVSTKAVKSA